MNLIDAVISQINSLIDASLPLGNVEYYGNTELVEVDGTTFPRCLQQRAGAKAILPDRAVPLKIYHRVESIEKATPDDEGFGLDIDELITADVSLYGIGDQFALSRAIEDTNQTIGMMVMDAIPTSHFPTANLPSNVLQIAIESAEYDGDKLAILGDELAGAELENRINKLIAFKIDYQIEARQCSGVCV